MPQARLRAGLGIFLVLCCLANVNLFAFQGPVVALNSKRIIFPASTASDTTQFNLQDTRPAVVPSSPSQAPAAAEQLPQPQLVTTGSVPGPDLIRAIQRELHVLGYEAGGIDGRTGLTTRAAIMAFEWDQGLPLTAEPAESVFQALLVGSTRRATAGSAADAVPGPQAVEVIRQVQDGLSGLGFAGLMPSGTLDAATFQAIRLFEVREKLPETGRISGALTSRITRLSAEKRLAARR